jgi:hypothetical protein
MRLRLHSIGTAGFDVSGRVSDRDPFEEPTGHRPLDYWGRNLLDDFLRLVPRLLANDGAAYLMQPR